MASMLAGCSGGNAADLISSDKGKELVYATAVDINDMNPHVYIGSTSAQGMVYESLIEHTEDGIKPLLAESWKVSDDGEVYIFHLRKDVKRVPDPAGDVRRWHGLGQGRA